MPYVGHMAFFVYRVGRNPFVYQESEEHALWQRTGIYLERWLFEGLLATRHLPLALPPEF